MADGLGAGGDVADMYLHDGQGYGGDGVGQCQRCVGTGTGVEDDADIVLSVEADALDGIDQHALMVALDVF